MNSDNRYHNRIKFISFFLGFVSIEKIDSFYNKKLQKWLRRNSHIVEYYELDINNNFIPRYDENGNILNAEFSKTTKDGIPLTEKDFIKSELRIIFSIDSDLLDLSQKKRIEYYIEYLNNKNRSKEEIINSQKITKVKKKESTLWFKVGLLFASGQIDELILKHDRNTTRIAEELGNTSYRPYISESISNTNKTDKNIFSSRNKMLEIIEYCKSNQIPVLDTFTNLLPEE